MGVELVSYDDPAVYPTAGTRFTLELYDQNRMALASVDVDGGNPEMIFDPILMFSNDGGGGGGTGGGQRSWVGVS